MKHFRTSYLMTLMLAVTLLGSMLFGNQPAGARDANQQSARVGYGAKPAQDAMAGKLAAPTKLDRPISQPQLPTVSTIFVDAAAACPGLGTPGAPFCAIQPAIDAANPGDTIGVAAGTYHVTQLLIQKSLILSGAGAATTIIDGDSALLTGTYGSMRITNPGGPVTVQGFTFRNAGQNADDLTPVLIGVDGNSTPVTIQNNHFIGYSGVSPQFDIGIWEYSSGIGGNLIIQNNEFEKMWQAILLEQPRGGSNVLNNNFHNLYPSTCCSTTYEPEGIFAFTYNSSANDVSSLVSVNGNTFANFNGSSIAFGGGYPGEPPAKFTNVEVKSNSISAIGTGPERRHVGIILINYGDTPANAALAGVQGATISGNTLTGTGGTDSYGIQLAGPNNNANVQNNTISGVSKGVAFEEKILGAGFPSGETVYNNSLFSNAQDMANGSGTVANASGNWWGTNTPAGVASAAGSNVDYTPWLNSGADTSGSTGFQGDFSYLNVDDNSPQSGATGRIQEGINGVATGGTVNVLAGTYVEQVDINKAITLHGAGQGSTIIQSPASLAATFGARRPIVLVHDVNAVVQNLTVDGLGLGSGTNTSMVGVGFHNAGGTLDHTTIVQIRDTPLDGLQQGVGIYALIDNATSRTLNIDRNIISDYQKNGMALKGTGLTVNVTNNAVTGAGHTNQIGQNGIQIGFVGGTGTIIGNVISGNFCTKTPECIGDPTTSSADGAAGILLYQTDNPSITVADNLLNGNQYGIWSVAVPALSIHGNTFLGAGGVGASIWNGDGGQIAQGTTGTINNNTFNGLSYGLIVFDVAGNQVAMSGHFNHFMGNTTYGAWSNSAAPIDLTNNWWNSPAGPTLVFGSPLVSGDNVSANITYSPFLVDPPAYAHLQPNGPITVVAGTNVTLDLLVNAGTHPAIGQQSYLTFPTGLLQVPSNSVTHDLTSFPLDLQNQVNNSTGEIAYASSVQVSPPGAGVTGDFRVAQITFAANTVGDATVRWQFYPPDPANRNSKITDSSQVVSDRTLYQDFVIHIVAPAQFTGHVFWEGRQATYPQPDAHNVLPITLTLNQGASTYSFPGLTTDASGNFSVNVESLPNGTYTWRVKGPQYLSTSGSVVLSHAPITSVEMGTQPVGDANNDNLVDISDFSILYSSFGNYSDPRADFNGDLVVDVTDFALLRSNFGRLGNLPGKTEAKQIGGSAVLELRPQGKAPANGGTVHVGDRFVLELWVNAQPGTNVVAQQSYLSFPRNQLQLGLQANANPVAGGTSLLTPDGRVLDIALQNAICNGPATCAFNGLKVPAGSLAFASATLNPTSGSGAFRIGQVTVQATAAGTSVLHWQFSPSDPITRNTKIVSDNGVTVSQSGQFVDYVLNVLPAGKGK